MAKVSSSWDRSCIDVFCCGSPPNIGGIIGGCCCEGGLSKKSWNKDNRFCGWVDVGLSDIGKKEAENAAKAIHDSGICVNKIYTSLLKRANQTVDKILERISVTEDIIHRDWRLNERHYGALTGLNKG